MFELWGKKRPVNGIGFNYEKICTFDRVESVYYMLSQLDSSIYQEGMVMGDDGRCYAFREYEKPNILKRIMSEEENDKD